MGARCWFVAFSSGLPIPFRDRCLAATREGRNEPATSAQTNGTNIAAIRPRRARCKFHGLTLRLVRRAAALAVAVALFGAREIAPFQGLILLVVLREAQRRDGFGKFVAQVKGVPHV